MIFSKEELEYLLELLDDNIRVTEEHLHLIAKIEHELETRE